ncbi:MAG: TonB family protein [Bacteroidia bacterium]|nr:TonB family protein [Bacteroidia bacterium]
MLANNWYNVVSDIRNDVVFQGRNQKYGAYQLRKEYNRTLAIIVLSMVAAALLALGIKYFIDNYKPSEDELANTKIDITQIDLTPPQLDKNEPPPPPPPPPPPVMETIKFVPPVIKEDAVEDEPPPPQEKVSETNVGTQTQEGSGDDNIQVPTEESGSGVIEEKAPEIFTVVQEMPEFPGGPMEMMKYIQKNIVYPPSAREAGISGKCFLRFVVNEDGKISSVEVLKGVPGCPECDKEAMRVIKSMPSWKPGKQNGKEVKVYFQLPINFTIK